MPVALTQYLISLFSIGLISVLYFVVGKKWNKSNFMKVTSIVLAIVFFFRFMLGHDAIQDTLALNNSLMPNGLYTALALITNWFMYAIELALILYPFFPKKFLANTIKYFALPISVLCLILLPLASVGIVGEEVYATYNIRTILMAFEFGISAIFSFIVFWQNDKFRTDKKSALQLLYIIPLMLLAVMPPYMLQGLFGHANIYDQLKSLSQFHRIILYLSILIPIGLYFLLRKKDATTIRLVLLYISLGTLLSFSIYHKFIDFTSVTGLPFHLCNTAMYIMPLCLIFKWNKLFYFTLFINVLGAFIAMAMPNYATGLNLVSTRIVEFYTNHFIAFFMPILIMALRVYERPKLKQFIYSMVAFAIYFVLMLILNAWFTNYNASVDYFFLNSDFVADKLGQWAEDLRNVVVSFNISGLTFTFYPIYQALFFLVYVALGAGVWFVYEWAFQTTDLLKDMSERKKKIKLDQLALEVKLNGRSKLEPMDLDGVNKLELINFGKRYGSSNVYAVKDACLTINGGEIFGFLGPNGAGKSTIIKSIVGIQPITEGSIRVCGYDVDTQSVMSKRMIGFVPDHYALYSKLTGREYINYIADLYDVSKEERTAVIDKYVTMLQLNEAFDNKIQTYSHGMKQKISIISALVHNPKVWILDEPLIGLDPTSIFQVKECMKEHAKNGNIVFFSSHIIDVVERICDRIAIIKKGHILDCKSVKEIEKTGTVEEFYMKTIKENDVTATQFTTQTHKLSKKEQKQELKKQKAQDKNNKKEPEQLPVQPKKKTIIKRKTQKVDDSTQ